VLAGVQVPVGNALVEHGLGPFHDVFLRFRTFALCFHLQGIPQGQFPGCPVKVDVPHMTQLPLQFLPEGRADFLAFLHLGFLAQALD